MWNTTWRKALWAKITGPWDILIIGGGITGAGILREATRLGLRALLVEQRDFAWGTSSRSSKLVHGGLRYLKEGRLGLTRASVQERQQLLHEGPGLIDPLGFLMTVYEGDFPGRWTFEVGLTVYDLLALRWEHAYYSPQDFQLLAPHIARQNLQGGFRYGDAQTDDARLVLRVLREAVAAGGAALNYVQAVELLRQDGQVSGVRLHDLAGERTADVQAGVVINATGAWADQLRAQVQAAPRIRPLRGSHLIFRLAAAGCQAITFASPGPPPGLHLPLGRRDPGRHHRRRPRRQTGRRAGHQPGRSGLSDGRRRGAVPLTRHHSGRRHLDLFRCAPRHRQRQSRPVTRIARPCRLGRKRFAHRHRRQTDHLPPDRAGCH
jgi:glycerol-3-phosphate dehydrogenase